MHTKREPRVNYHTMIVLAFIAGGLGVALQFMTDGEILAFMLSGAALGGLIGESSAYGERDRRQLSQSYKTVFEWLLLAMMVAYAILLTSRWWNVIAGFALFLNNHWPGLIISLMCLFMGLAGFQRTTRESST